MMTLSNDSDLLQDKIIQFKLEKWGHNPTAEQYLIFYKFGDRVFQAKDKAAAIEEFKSLLQKEINPRNLRCYVESFRNRTDISEKLMEKLKCDTLLLVGDKSSFLHTTETMYKHADKSKTSILRIDDVGDVLAESPGKVSQSILLFCQGIGLLTSLSSCDRLRTVSNSSGGEEGERRPSMSMEDYDRSEITQETLQSSIFSLQTKRQEILPGRKGGGGGDQR